VALRARAKSAGRRKSLRERRKCHSVLTPLFYSSDPFILLPRL
jgi:hypothetical protein